jgi:hypothetical protein
LYAVRIVIGALLAAVVSIAVFVWMPYQRELGIARRIQEFSGKVQWTYSGADCVPQSIRGRLPFCERICRVDLDNTQVTDAGFEHLKGLANLVVLKLRNTQVTDVGLEHLKGMTKLEIINLSGTRLTDAGLEHLKGLTNLSEFGLDNTQVTDAGLEHLKGLTDLTFLHVYDSHTTANGRVKLRKALPNCEIWPDP